MTELYTTKIYNYNKNILFTFVVGMTYIFGLVYFTIVLFHPPLFIILPLLMFGYFWPLIFKKRIVDFFTNDSKLEFSDKGVKVFIRENDDSDEFCFLFWDDIATFRFHFTQAKNITLTIKLKHGGYKFWNFPEKLTLEESIQKQSVVSIFLKYINEYNSRNKGHKILLDRGFLNSNKGKILIYGMIGIVISAFLIHLIINPNKSFITLIVGSMPLLSLYGLKNEQDKIYKKMEPLSLP